MNPEEMKELALRYAPIFAQKVSHEWVIADQIAPVDLAGDMADVADNPDALCRLPDDARIDAKVYYSVCETSTHYFILYAVYHVLDWWKRFAPSDLYNIIRDRLDEHIHDMEGALVVVTREPAGLVDALLTVAHNNFYLYSEPRRPTDLGESRPAHRKSLRIAKFNETIDGNIWLDRESSRVKLYIESRGHGIRGDHSHWGAGDEIWYYRPAGEEERIRTMDEKNVRKAVSPTYELTDIFEPDGLWSHRFDDGVFRQNEDGRWGLVYRDEKGRLHGGAANPPWSWNDHNDPSPIGEMATDPAAFISRYAQGWGPISTSYVSNPYLGI